MGVDYRTDMGFGFTFDLDENIPKSLKPFISYDDYVDDDEVMKWLDSLGVQTVRAFRVGNMMTGDDQTWLFTIDHLHKSWDDLAEMQGVFEFDEPALTMSEHEDLIDTYKALHEHGAVWQKPRWILAFTIY